MQNLQSSDEDDFFALTGLNYDYVIDFLLPVTTLCLTLLSIMVELQQVINLCLDFDEDDILGSSNENQKSGSDKNENQT